MVALTHDNGVMVCALTVALGIGVIAMPASAQGHRLSDFERFNTVVGTQTIGASYQFAKDTLLVETAQAILDMGSNVLKFNMSKDYFGGRGKNVPTQIPSIKTLTDLARDEPSHKRVLDMPFANYVIWAYCFTPGWWNKGFAPADRDKEYREFYDFACYLLKTYSGTGKTFYLGHWEGDWHLRNGYDFHDDSNVTPEAVQGMTDWINTRQKAVDDAKRDTPHADVQVYAYLEVNLVKIALAGRACVTNSVLPKTNVDFVSYSSYDSGTDLKPALDYIEAKLPAKAGLPGKRVWIGEYGFPAIANSPAKQEELSRQVMRTGLEWGCPFVLYWEMFNNEVDKDGTQRGFWLIDDKGHKTPLYLTHQRYYEQSRRFLLEFQKTNHRLPTNDEYCKQAVQWLIGNGG